MDGSEQELDRLLDADHSALAACLATDLERQGWMIRAEVSFNHYGDRGRIDLLACQPVRRVLLVIEIKTRLVDAQALLGSLDVKTRLAPEIAREAGWLADHAVPAIILLDSTTTRRHLADLDALFRRFSVRGHAARRWISAPAERVGGLLLLLKLPPGNGIDRRRAGRRRVRISRSPTAHSSHVTATPLQNGNPAAADRA
ncbi:MAG TPA: hypothetical protein VNB06_04150 [Thermoanaerobaculia bacterium]|nr:hypothetical protein [Thermoanaerobaculia bacterium]